MRKTSSRRLSDWLHLWFCARAGLCYRGAVFEAVAGLAGQSRRLSAGSPSGTVGHALMPDARHRPPVCLQHARPARATARHCYDRLCSEECARLASAPHVRGLRYRPGYNYTPGAEPTTQGARNAGFIHRRDRGMQSLGKRRRLVLCVGGGGGGMCITLLVLQFC